MTIDVEAFLAARPRLLGIAYRMLGSMVEAEDVVGDVAERWTAVDRAEVVEAEGWLVTVTTRRALDVARSARVQRVDYPGEWLPEPVATGPGGELGIERAESLTMGFLLLLERLTPIERAVFVLHDVFDHPYDLIATAVGRTEAACRQALHRAREHVTVPARTVDADRERAEAVATQFLAVSVGGELDRLLELLAPGITFTSDGGGVVRAAMRVVTEPQRVARLVANLAGKTGDDPLIVPCELNGEPGVVMHTVQGWAALLATTDGDRIAAIRLVVNPAKLAHLIESMGDVTAGRPDPWADSPGRFRHRRGRPITR